jgi:LysM repeat protein
VTQTREARATFTPLGASPNQNLSATPLPTFTAVATCPPTRPQGWQDYRIQSGDTLSAIAVNTNSTVVELSRVNCIEDARFIVVGTTLFVPMLPEVTAPQNNGGSNSNNNSSNNSSNNTNTQPTVPAGSTGDDDDDDDDDDGGDDD